MSAILYDELPPRLRKAAEMFGATRIEPTRAEWVSTMGALSVSVEPRRDPDDPEAFTLAARVGMSDVLPSDAAHALVRSMDDADTIRRALSAAYMLRDVTVFTRSAPCSSCSATGKSLGRACARCDGTGKRTRAEVP